MRSAIAIAFSVIAMSVFTGTALAAPATVYPASPSGYSGFGSDYAGSGTMVMPPPGCFIDANHNFLLDGSAVDSTMLLSGGDTLHGVVTPGGVAIIVVNTCGH